MAKRGRPPFDDVLTPAEWKVCEGIRHGLTNAQIATRLGVGRDAVKYHVGNALLKLGLRDRRELRHWDGIRRDSALSHRSNDMTAAPDLGAIGQVARSVSDIDASERWFRDVLGLTPLYRFGTLAFFDAGGVRLLLSQSDAVTPESILYFVVPDIHAAHAALSARGVEFLGAPHLIHTHGDGSEEWMVFFRDPDARPLALMARTAPR